MSVYVDQNAKNEDLRALVRWLVQESERPLDANSASLGNDTAKQRAYDNAAGKLSAILNTPVAEPAPDPVQPMPDWNMSVTITPETMGVWVALPRSVRGQVGEGSATLLAFQGREFKATLTPLERTIVGALLDHAREQLDD
jgi:hypothetical protein